MVNSRFPFGFELGVSGLELLNDRGEVRIAFEPVPLSERLKVVVPSLVWITRDALQPVFDLGVQTDDSKGDKMRITATQIVDVCHDNQIESYVPHTRVGDYFVAEEGLQLPSYKLPNAMGIVFGPITGFMGAARAVHSEIEAHPNVGLITAIEKSTVSVNN